MHLRVLHKMTDKDRFDFIDEHGLRIQAAFHFEASAWYAGTNPAYGKWTDEVQDGNDEALDDFLSRFIGLGIIDVPKTPESEGEWNALLCSRA